MPLGGAQNLTSPLPYTSDIVDDWNNYDTSIAIPYNLADGYYVLQWMAITGNSARIYYSCARLYITGGTTDLSCEVPNTIAWMNAALMGCNRAGGPLLQSIVYSTNQFGRFCFNDPAATRPGQVYEGGDVDSSISALPPVNADCDSRAGCWSAKNQTACELEFMESGYPEPADPTIPFVTCQSDGASSTSVGATKTTSSTTSTVQEDAELPLCPVPNIQTSTTVTTVFLTDKPIDSASSADVPTCTTGGITTSIIVLVTSVAPSQEPSPLPQTPSPTTTQDYSTSEQVVEPSETIHASKHSMPTQETDPCYSPLRTNMPCSGKSRCSGPYWAVCSSGVWIVRACAQGTVCKELGDAFVCDYPTEGDCVNSVQGASLIG
jgi:hypothetical protein